LQHWKIQVVQGRMFDGSTIQDIVTRHLDLFQEKFMHCSFQVKWEKQSISRGCETFWSGLLKTVSFFWRWVNTDWTFFWPISF